MQKPKSCNNCGKCCTFEIEVYSNDDVPEELTEFMEEWKIPVRVMKRNESSNTCIALDLKTFRCSIYDKRPTVCRDFEIGCRDCMIARSNCVIKIPPNHLQA